MDKRQQELAYFISFCIEQYKVAKGLSGEEVVKLFNQYKVMEYLVDKYLFHTEGSLTALKFIEAKEVTL